jgi:hypothetical protein
MNIQEARIAAYKDLFVHRDDVHAHQKPDGRYFLRLAPVTDEVVKAHLEGRITAGWYVLDRGSTAKWVVLDADSADGIERLQHCFLSLDKLGVPSTLEQSRRGGHLWIFLERPIPGRAVRDLVSTALPDLGPVEVFPKQDSLDGKKVGSLIRGPLGTHLLSSGRYPFVDPVSLKPLARTTLTMIDALIEAPRLSIKRAAEIVTALRQVPAGSGGTAKRPRLHEHAAELRRSPIAELKECIGDPLAFLSRYVALDVASRGSCPFHPPDQRLSFALNPRTGRWTDFHEFDPQAKRYTAGDVIDFYARYKGVTVREALHRLGEEYG